MSARDRRLAAEMAKKHGAAYQSASDKAKAKAAERNGGTPPPSRTEQMRDLIGRQRDEASKERARKSKRNIQDHSGAFIDRDPQARSITDWLFRGR